MDVLLEIQKSKFNEIFIDNFSNLVELEIDKLAFREFFSNPESYLFMTMILV